MKYDSYTVNNIIDVTKKYEAKDYLQPSILMISNILILLGCIFALNSLKNTKLTVRYFHGKKIRKLGLPKKMQE